MTIRLICATIKIKKIPDPNWLSGFVTGDGSFDIRIIKLITKKGGYRIQLRFRITQHDRDIELMELIIKYLGTGKINKYSSKTLSNKSIPTFGDVENKSIIIRPDHNVTQKSAVSISIVKFSDIINIIIPLFEKNPLLGVKLLEFLDWCKVAKLMNDGTHNTPEGLKFIQQIKSGMNKGRKK